MSIGFVSDVGASVSALWDTALREARGAVVFVDAPTSESLRWIGGVQRLRKAGATVIKDFSCFQAGGASDTRALFLVSGSVQSSPCLDTIQAILGESCFESASVVTGVPISPTPERTAAQEIVHLQRQLRQWMGSDDTISKVVHIPLVFSSILPSLLVTSPLHGLFPPLPPLDDVAHQTLATEKKMQLKSLVSSLSLLLGQLQLRDELLSLGKLAYTVADELEYFDGTVARRKQLPEEAKKACLLFFDRTLDLVAPLSNRNDNIIDVVRAVLPPFDSIDAAIDMTPICRAELGLTSAGPTVARGTLSCLPQSKLVEIHNLKWKLCPLYLRDEFTSLIKSCGLQDEVEADEDPVRFVCKNLQVFKGASMERLSSHAQTLVSVAALSETLSSAKMQRRLEKLAIEKLFTQNATENSLSGALDAGEALVQLTEGRDKTKLDFEDLVSMFLYINSLCGEDLYVDQRSREGFQQGLLAAITDDTLRNSSEWSELAKHLVPSLNASEAKLQAAVARVEEAARRVGTQRRSLKTLRRVLTRGDLAHPSTYRPLLVEAVDTLKARLECPDIESHSSATGVLGGIQGGLGFLMGAVGAAMGSAANGPFERADVLIVVVLGGVTLAEVAMLEQTMADTGKQLIVLSTQLLTPKETLDCVFSSMT